MNEPIKQTVLSRREYFAAAALQGLLASCTDESYLACNCSRETLNRRFCKVALELADEMLVQLEESLESQTTD